MPQPNVPPTSSVMIAAIPGARSINRSAAFVSTTRRCPGGVPDHSANAAAAESHARRASSRPAAAATVTAAPVNGSTRSNVAAAGGRRPLPADQQLLLLHQRSAGTRSSSRALPW